MKERLITAKEQLRIIEGLCIATDTLPYATMKDIHQAYMDLSETVYMVAHLNGSCKNPHLDWHKKARQIQKQLHKAGII